MSEAPEHGAHDFIPEWVLPRLVTAADQWVAAQPRSQTQRDQLTS